MVAGVLTGANVLWKLPYQRGFFVLRGPIYTAGIGDFCVAASMLGLNDIFWLSAVIFIAIIPLIWLTKPPGTEGPGWSWARSV
ncbi:hypothetical protein F6X40_03375 [Paraburkholderia sp. UCT31]|uniref:hypothetical protein n=1 Tax=Paraburkholderia sp. UCT31 TaxID=2615209 RepID=UPI0016562A06|nr:hypothetical protein [Paraburkholderia sp. UCT31]MBC8735892.1 hypothetical protein [Paraburkholderia sp. UCT31]